MNIVKLCGCIRHTLSSCGLLFLFVQLLVRLSALCVASSASICGLRESRRKKRKERSSAHPNFNRQTTFSKSPEHYDNVRMHHAMQLLNTMRVCVCVCVNYEIIENIRRSSHLQLTSRQRNTRFIYIHNIYI